MAIVIEPKVNVVCYGPVSAKVSPDEFVYGAAGITYKDIGALTEVEELKEADADIRAKMVKSLIKSAGSGHASMATTPGLWVFLEGNCSKLVDSLFTGARFSSSLMPSGRRIPITKEQIVVPKGIHKIGRVAEDLYTETIAGQIGVYEEMQKKGIPKEEASKIVSYGHRGGGFLFMPLETLVAYSKMFDRERHNIPLEGREIIEKLERFVHENGMDVTYEARRNSPREAVPNPNIFSRLCNEAEFQRSESLSSRVVSFRNDLTPEALQEIADYLQYRTLLTKESIKEKQVELAEQLDALIENYGLAVRVKTFTHSPWRVWGEVKRHRTLPHIVESVYHAIENAQYKLNRQGNLSDSFSIPPGVLGDREKEGLWEKVLIESLGAYRRLCHGFGANASDAVALIPRGLKLGIVKDYDLFNLAEGYMPLRLCNTAEPEMRRTTEIERDLVLGAIPELSGLISPKCAYNGFCHEADYSRCCGKIRGYVFGYDQDFHDSIAKAREGKIRERIKQ